MRRAAASLLAIALAACGGGGAPVWRLTDQVEVQGGDSVRPVSAHLAPLPGPTVALPVPQVVEACIAVRWRVDVAAAGTARLTLRAGVGELESSWPMLVDLRPPAAEIVTTHCAEIALPAGQSPLRGEALLVTSGLAPILGRTRVLADWTVEPRR